MEICESVCEKTNNLGFDQVRHKPGCTVTEDGKRLEILDLESRGIVLSCSENKGVDQLRGYCEADLRLCFRIGKLLVFSCGGSIFFSYETRNMFLIMPKMRCRPVVVFMQLISDFSATSYSASL